MLNFEIIPYSDNFDDYPEVDIALCNWWLTAFPLAKFRKCRQKYYLLQDFDPVSVRPDQLMPLRKKATDSVLSVWPIPRLWPACIVLTGTGPFTATRPASIIGFITRGRTKTISERRLQNCFLRAAVNTPQRF